MKTGEIVLARLGTKASKAAQETWTQGGCKRPNHRLHSYASPVAGLAPVSRNVVPSKQLSTLPLARVSHLCYIDPEKWR
jgi:hypothetical protein